VVAEKKTLEKKDRVREAISSLLQEEGEEEKTEEGEQDEEKQSLLFEEVRYHVWSCEYLNLI